MPAPEIPERYRPPSVHISWSAPANSEVQREGITWFYNEITVTETATSTYYMTNGFDGGYMGIQDRYPKYVLFSVWEKTSKDDNPNASPDDLVTVLAKGEGVTVEHFVAKVQETKVTLPTTGRWVTSTNSWSTSNRTHKIGLAMDIDAKACGVRLGSKLMLVLGFKQRGEVVQPTSRMQTTRMSFCLQMAGNLK